MSDARAEYALIRARVELRLAELRVALDRHELGQRWERAGALERVERGLAEVLSALGEKRAAYRRPVRYDRKRSCARMKVGICPSNSRP